MHNSKNRAMSAEELAQFGAELEAIKQEQLADVGEVDARYIRRIVTAVRYTEVMGRGFLFLSFFPPFWLLGVFILAL
jgi:linoleoyl-CoA desaturase